MQSLWRSFPSNASSLKFQNFNSHIMGLCFPMYVNLELSLRNTSHALKDLFPEPSWVIVSPTTAVSNHVYLPCAWHFEVLKIFPKSSSLLPMDTVPIFLPPGSFCTNTARILSSTSLRALVLQMMTP